LISAKVIDIVNSYCGYNYVAYVAFVLSSSIDILEGILEVSPKVILVSKLVRRSAIIAAIVNTLFFS